VLVFIIIIIIIIATNNTMSNDVGRQSSVDLFYFYATPSVALYLFTPDDFSTSTRGLARTMAKYMAPSHHRLVRLVSACRRNIEKLQDITQGSNSAASVEVAVAMAAVHPNANNNTRTRRV